MAMIGVESTRGRIARDAESRSSAIALDGLSLGNFLCGAEQIEGLCGNSITYPTANPMPRL